MRKFAFVLLMISFSSICSFAGWEMHGKYLGAPYESSIKVYVDGNKYRQDLTFGEKTMTDIYIKDTGKVWTIHGNKTYVEHTKETAAAKNNTQQQMRLMREKQMASMPPQVKAQMEAMTKKMNLPQVGKTHQVTYKNTGRREKVGKWNCEVYQIVTNGAATSDICVASYKDLGVDKEQFGRLMTEKMELKGEIGAAQVGGHDLSAIQRDAPGFTIKQRDYNGKGGFDLVKFEQKSLPSSLFEVPSGYIKVDPEREMQDMMKNAQEKRKAKKRRN